MFQLNLFTQINVFGLELLFQVLNFHLCLFSGSNILQEAFVVADIPLFIVNQTGVQGTCSPVESNCSSCGNTSVSARLAASHS